MPETTHQEREPIYAPEVRVVYKLMPWYIGVVTFITIYSHTALAGVPEAQTMRNMVPFMWTYAAFAIFALVAFGGISVRSGGAENNE